MKKAEVPSELHVLTGVAHGFGMRWSNPAAVAAWPKMFLDWLDALDLLNEPPPPASP
jgi:hypothetical protein